MTEIDLHIMFKNNTGLDWYKDLETVWLDDEHEFGLIAETVVRLYNEVNGDIRCPKKEYINWLENKLINNK